MNPTYKEYSELNKKFLESHKDEIKVEVSEEVNYLLRQYWLLGYVAGQGDLIVNSNKK